MISHGRPLICCSRYTNLSAGFDGGVITLVTMMALTTKQGNEGYVYYIDQINSIARDLWVAVIRLVAQ